MELLINIGCHSGVGGSQIFKIKIQRVFKVMANIISRHAASTFPEITLKPYSSFKNTPLHRKFIKARDAKSLKSLLVLSTFMFGVKSAAHWNVCEVRWKEVTNENICLLVPNLWWFLRLRIILPVLFWFSEVLAFPDNFKRLPTRIYTFNSKSRDLNRVYSCTF